MSLARQLLFEILKSEEQANNLYNKIKSDMKTENKEIKSLKLEQIVDYDIQSYISIPPPEPFTKITKIIIYPAQYDYEYSINKDLYTEVRAGVKIIETPPDFQILEIKTQQPQTIRIKFIGEANV